MKLLKCTLFKTIIIIVFIVLIFSCKQQTKKQNPDYILNINTQELIKNLRLSQIFDDDYTFVKLETTKDFQIGRINKVICFDNFIYVLDTYSASALAKFSMTGEFISLIGSKGEGPGQYQMPMDFTIDKNNNHIFVLDMGVSLIEYDENERYIKKRKFSDFNFSAVQLEKTTFGFAFVSGERDDNLILTDNKLNIINSYFPYVNRSLNKLIISPLQHPTKTTTIFRKFLNDTIYKISNNSIKPHVILNYKNNFAKDLFSKNISTNKFRKLLSSGNTCNTKLYFENKNSIFTAFNTGSNIYLSFYSILNDSLITCKYFNFIDDITFNRKSYIIGTKADKFIYFIQAHDFIAGLDAAKNEFKNTSNYNKAIKIASGLNDSSNPVLLFVKLKF